jgi:putative acetyltransferase
VSQLQIREEIPSDIQNIRAVEAAAFPTEAEANLVDQLRQDGSAVYSLVAIADGRVVGHAMFSKMHSPEGSLGLAPVAVLDGYRRQGIAAHLIRTALSRAKADGWKAVFVLGDPYYERFGFDPRMAAAFASPYAGPHFMALELQPRALAAGGQAQYPNPFAALG